MHCFTPQGMPWSYLGVVQSWI
ncbi:hypothetical protein ID866_8973 [Astraeus odoratus]|nr:hypothetical protein ID866_8973 [Astraeus odoratus]